jgi:hypothetical protein
MFPSCFERAMFLAGLAAIVLSAHALVAFYPTRATAMHTKPRLLDVVALLSMINGKKD